MLVAFSCKQRELCPSCAAKRGAELAAFLADHVLEDVPHAQWVFTIPKMLRPLFFRRRELRGSLARLAWQTVRELMAAAVEEPDPGPGMVSVIQTFGDRINPHPHVHALVSRGGWTRDERFIPIPYVDPHAAQELFQHKVFGFLQRRPDVHPVTLLYVQEALQAFRSGCILSSSVMLGVVTEHTFLLLLETVEKSPVYAKLFATVREERSILPRVNGVSWATFEGELRS